MSEEQWDEIMERANGTADEFFAFIRNSAFYQFAIASPQSLSVFELCHRAGEQLRSKEKNIKTVREYEAHIDAQKNFILVLRRSLVRVPHGERVPFVSFNGIAILEADISKSIGWVNWYKSKRAKYETHIHRIEKDIPVYPEFKILKISGNYTQLKVKANIPVFELKYRVRQAFAFFWMVWNIHCSPNDAPLPGEKLPQGPHILNPELNPKPRIDRDQYFFDYELTLRDALIKITELYLISVIKYGIMSELLPFVQVADSELQPDHGVNAVKLLGID